jgi:hypothetical protein
MTITAKPILLVYFVLGVTLLFLLREFWRKPKLHPVSYETAIEATKLMKDWGSWMTTVSTAVIGTSGVMVSLNGSPPREQWWAHLSVLHFGLSIVFAAWVLGSLPSVVVRLRKESPASGIVFDTTDSAGTPQPTVSAAVSPSAASTANFEPTNDIYEMTFFSFIPVRVGVIAALQHVFFVLGLYCFALYVTGCKWSLLIVLLWL